MKYPEDACCAGGVLCWVCNRRKLETQTCRPLTLGSPASPLRLLIRAVHVCGLGRKHQVPHLCMSMNEHGQTPMNEHGQGAGSERHGQGGKAAATGPPEAEKQMLACCDIMT